MQAPAKAQTAAKKVQKKAPAAARKTGAKATKGWLGGAGGAQDLDRWYGEPQEAPAGLHTLLCKVLPTQQLSARLFAGPDRALFLPGGLLDRSDVPAYLNGSLAGE